MSIYNKIFSKFTALEDEEEDDVGKPALSFSSTSKVQECNSLVEPVFLYIFEGSTISLRAHQSIHIGRSVDIF